jgi:hypothetical protein
VCCAAAEAAAPRIVLRVAMLVRMQAAALLAHL